MQHRPSVVFAKKHGRPHLTEVDLGRGDDGGGANSIRDAACGRTRARRKSPARAEFCKRSSRRSVAGSRQDQQPTRKEHDQRDILQCIRTPKQRKAAAALATKQLKAAGFM